MPLKDLRSLLQEPCVHHAVRRLQVFGSVSRGQETLGSDIAARERNSVFRQRLGDREL